MEVPQIILKVFFDGYKEMGLLSKFGGGIGWDWNKVRARSSVIDNNINAAGGTTPWLKRGLQRNDVD